MSIRRLIPFFVTLILLVSLAAPAMAQDSTTAPTSAEIASEAAPVTGAGTLILLMGIGAVVIVGGIAILRDNAKRSAS